MTVLLTNTTLNFPKNLQLSSCCVLTRTLTLEECWVGAEDCRCWGCKAAELWPQERHIRQNLHNERIECEFTTAALLCDIFINAYVLRCREVHWEDFAPCGNDTSSGKDNHGSCKDYFLFNCLSSDCVSHSIFHRAINEQLVKSAPLPIYLKLIGTPACKFPYEVPVTHREEESTIDHNIEEEQVRCQILQGHYGPHNWLLGCLCNHFMVFSVLTLCTATSCRSGSFKQASLLSTIHRWSSTGRWKHVWKLPCPCNIWRQHVVVSCSPRSPPATCHYNTRNESSFNLLCWTDNSEL